MVRWEVESLSCRLVKKQKKKKTQVKHLSKALFRFPSLQNHAWNLVS